MVMLGALLANMDLLSIEDVETALEEHLPERHKKFMGGNKAALRKGAEFIV
jgi:Pyruvate/2-oxoacid:ferredoxin oxidoreductase gamma subunit